MKPNDKAYAAARAEGKRWETGSYYSAGRQNSSCHSVLRQDGENGAFDVVAEFNNREERDEALERLRAEAMVDAAYAAQFKSEDYAELVERLKHKVFYRDDWLEPMGAIPVQVNKDMSNDEGVYSQFYNPDGPEAADALEAVLAERYAWKGRQEATAAILKRVEAERDALLARLAPVDDEALVEIGANAISKFFNEMPNTLRGGQARAAIAAIRPHIEAAERERIADTIKNWGDDPHFQLLAAAIRRGK